MKRQTANKVRAQMTALGIYQPEFDAAIDMYCDLTNQYASLSKKFKDSGYRYAQSTAAGGDKKDPLIATLEALRRDILSYANHLGLTPAGLKKIVTELETDKSQSGIERVLAGLQRGGS